LIEINGFACLYAIKDPPQFDAAGQFVEESES
jgi:hypothetical protein